MSKHSGTHSPPGASLSQTQELPPNVMELWVYLTHGSPYFLILKWKEWEKSEQCLYRKQMLPGALLWDYENWPRVRISREGWIGAVLLLVFFFPSVGWFCSVLGWVLLGWVRLLLPVPRTQGPFFSCQSQPDVPRLVLRFFIPHFSSKWVIRVTAHTQKLGGHILTQKYTHTHVRWHACTQTRPGWGTVITGAQKESQSRNGLQ